ncbi:unnamed protein product [Darwinula stevensoni]|uniref:Activation-induced cytidine deaminase AID domain-containing protein n=1 Tax=Darwinula stevensoni TaxID=69355 RepID=A0A7R9AGA4_9CRUS|nr:unnamed protein product [Darwinula stevensoni]CAG0903230.1 unnamed protein product [Darwinula stevensoni]
MQHASTLPNKEQGLTVYVLPYRKEAMAEPKVQVLYEIFKWTGESVDEMNKINGLMQLLEQFGAQPKGDQKYWPTATICFATVKVSLQPKDETSSPSTEHSSAFYCGIHGCGGDNYHTELQLIKWIKDLNISPSDIEEIQIYSNHSPCMACCNRLLQLQDRDSPIPLQKVSLSFRRKYRKSYINQEEHEELDGLLKNKMNNFLELQKEDIECFRSKFLEYLEKEVIKEKPTEEEMKMTDEWLDGLNPVQGILDEVESETYYQESSSD